MVKKILLVITPYWDPMIPPLGITTLKGFLQKNGYQVKTMDYIVHKESLDFYSDYFEVLRQIVPEEKQGNFNNIGHDVLQNHMMAYQTYSDWDEYVELIRLLIYNHYYTRTDSNHIETLHKIMDTFYKMLGKHFTNLLDEYRPDVVGATFYKCTLPSSLFVLKLAKERYPEIKTLAGGGTFNESHAPGSPSFENLLNLTKDYLDKIILGPGELLFLEYLKGNLDDEKRVYSKADINNEILSFAEQEIPDFSDLDLSKYPYMAATASAGCIYDCSFCVAKKVAGTYRTKDPDQLVEQMKKLHTYRGHQLFFMTDSLINPVLDDFTDSLIRENVSFYFDAYFKIDKESADIQKTLKWRRGGLYRVRIGAESGSQKILDKMNKLITVEETRASITALAGAGIKTTTYWVIGHPGETEEDFQLTLDLVEELKDDIFQAECNYFLYHYSQQGCASEWEKYRMPLYPAWADNILVFKHWTLDYPPIREVTFNRVFRFTEHCKKLGIPNPYSYNEHVHADKRWQRLHRNAVPPIIDLMSLKSHIDENKNIKIGIISEKKQRVEIDFNFR
jgi:hypothetical protein